MYTAVILDQKSKDDLKEAAQLLYDKNYITGISGVQLPHHMTINLGEFDERLNDPEILGMQAIVRVERFFWDTTVCCAQVTEALALHVEDGSVVDLIPINTLNDEEYSAHVTLGVKNGGRPRDSKYLFTSQNAFQREFPAITLLGEIKIAY